MTPLVAAGYPAIYYVLAHEQFTVPQLIEQGVAAETAGFSGVWTSDHFQPWQPNEGHSGLAWMTLAALTQRTSRITFGTGVTCPSFRYRPAIVAQAWATLNRLAPGRVFLGVGTGEKINEGAAGGGWGGYRERSDRLLEAIDIMRKLWTGEEVDLQGEFWSVRGKLYDPPVSKIPVYIAAGGPKSAMLAGIYGDGLITSASQLLNRGDLRDAWNKGLLEGGREIGSKPIMVEHWAVVGGDEEARTAARKWRFIPRAWESGYYDNMDPSSIQANAEREVPLESAYKEWVVSESPEDHIRAFRKLSDAGATVVVVHVAMEDQARVIDFFGDRVLPATKS